MICLRYGSQSYLYQSIFEMNQKIIFLVIAILLIQTNGIKFVEHYRYSNNCSYFSVGEIQKNSNFTYTIKKEWTFHELDGKYKEKTLNALDYMDINGWTPYEKPSIFLEAVGKQGPSILSNQQVKFIRQVLQKDDAPGYGFKTQQSLQLAFGRPSRAAIYQVPVGRALIALRFQPSVNANLTVGPWSVLIDIVDQDDIEYQLKAQYIRIKNEMKKHSVTPLDVARSLNIIPQFTVDSIIYNLFYKNGLSSPAKGTVQIISYDAFLVVIRGKKEFLAGPIHDGQSDLVQIKDLIKKKESCV